MKKIILLVFSFFVFAGSLVGQERIKLESYKKIDNPAREEVSGIIKSLNHKNTYWVHGDSGTKDRIYAIDSDGEIKSSQKNYKGTEIKGAKNTDWEDIAQLPNGDLIIADFGNNCHCRKDMKIFIIEEPNPKDDKVEVSKEYRIEYPKRGGLKGLLFEENHNAEALFTIGDEIFVITKNELRGESILFQLENPSEDDVNILVEIDRFEFKGQVTAADSSPDDSMIAVLTYQSIWIFKPEKNTELFNGEIYMQRFRGVEQVESVTFSGKYLIIAEENGDLYRLKVSDIPIHKK